MTDKMLFPETMTEFVRDHSFRDTDEVYTNGCMLIPTFRVEQAIEHFEPEIRNQAIAEFVERLKNDTMTKTFGLRSCDINRIAEDMRKEETCNG